ncbi:MAG: capsular exopolysaccharide family [Anaerocolumna sp.]|jgi:capsular polysaccharide biosynthesis protein|nr:capsular exopolysaccharide family [Anaerocolumna sp.]
MERLKTGTKDTFSEYSQYLRNKMKTIIIVTVLAGLLVGFVNRYIISDYYYAVTKLQTGMQAADDLIRLMENRNILEKVILEADADLTTAELRETMYLSLVENTRVIELTVYDYDADRAVALVNAYITVVKMEYGDIFEIKVLEEAGRAQVFPKEDVVGFVRGALLGGIITILVLTIRFIKGTRIKTAQQVEEYLSIAVLAVVPITDVKAKLRKGGSVT